MFGKGCINPDKLAQAGAAGPCQTWCGYEFNLAGLREGGIVKAFIHVDRAKLEKLKNYFEGPEYARVGEGIVTSASHRSAAGLLVWISRPSYTLRVLLSLFGVMNPFFEGEMLRPIGDEHHVRSLWALSQVTAASGALHCPLWGGVDAHEQSQHRMVHLMGSDASLSFQEDASGAVILDSKGRPELEGGCGFTCHKTRVWFSSSIREFLPALRLAFGEDTKIIIFFCELLMIVAGALEVGPAWAGCLVGVPVDNSNAFYALSKFRSTHPMCQLLLGILARLMIQFKFDVLPLQVSTKDNTLNDFLSREYAQPEEVLQAEVNRAVQECASGPLAPGPQLGKTPGVQRYSRIDLVLQFNFL